MWQIVIVETKPSFVFCNLSTTQQVLTYILTYMIVLLHLFEILWTNFILNVSSKYVWWKYRVMKIHLFWYIIIHFILALRFVKKSVYIQFHLNRREKFSRVLYSLSSYLSRNFDEGEVRLFLKACVHYSKYIVSIETRIETSYNQ